MLDFHLLNSLQVSMSDGMSGQNLWDKGLQGTLIDSLMTLVVSSVIWNYFHSRQITHELTCYNCLILVGPDNLAPLG